jgi:hypothetical protein
MHVEREGTSIKIGAQRLIGRPLTIDQLFDLVHGRLRGWLLSIRYHPTLGYPTEFRINPGLAMDDELGGSVLRVVPLP